MRFKNDTRLAALHRQNT